MERELPQPPTPAETAARHEQGLLRHSMLLLAATQLANVSNLVFQVLMGWSLDRVQYGVLITMLNITLIVATPMDALRTAVAHFSARCVRTGRPGAVLVLVKRWCARLLCVAIPVAMLGAIASGPVAGFFHMESAAPVVLTCAAIVGLVVLPVMIGALQGVQSFVWMSVSQYAWSIVRLGVGVALVLWVTKSALAGLWAQAVGVFTAVVFGVLGLRAVLGRAEGGEEPSHGVGAYFLRSLVMLAGYAVLMNADMILVKHFFDPDRAGLFAQAATIGRSIIFLPMPIALAMFPKVISMGGSSKTSRHTLALALGMVAVLIGAAATAVAIWPWLPLRVMYNIKTPSEEQLKLVQYVIWAMAPLGVAYLIMNFEMAQHRFKAVPWLALIAAGYVGGVIAWHGSLMQVVGVLAVCTVAACLLFAVLVMRAGAGTAQPPQA